MHNQKKLLCKIVTSYFRYLGEEEKRTAASNMKEKNLCTSVKIYASEAHNIFFMKFWIEGRRIHQLDNSPDSAWIRSTLAKWALLPIAAVDSTLFYPRFHAHCIRNL